MSNAPTPVYCANHPGVETSLRCNRCEKPICPKCAIATPTGYRCKECVRGQQKSFETAVWQDYLFSSFIAGVLAFLGSLVIPLLGFFTIIVSPIGGVIIAEVVRAITKKRRSKRLYQVVVIMIVVGCLPTLLLGLATSLAFFSQGGLGSLWSILWKAVYAFVIASTAYYRLSGIQISLGP
jgi:uncharacterized membrane protein